MAALSFSPSPPPTTPQRSNSSSSSNNTTNSSSTGNNSKENSSHHVKSLGANKPFQKITVHNVLSESGANALQQQHFSNQNTIIRKIKDFGMLGTVHNATAATTPAMPATMPRKRPLGDAKRNGQQQQPPNSSDNKTPATAKRTKLSKKSQQQQQQQEKQLSLRQQEKLELINRPAGTPGRKGLPLPQAVARRNARERNRVKQVNNGFAALRERIPEEVSEAFEAQGAGRGASKKLSKVETLRMAVEYIRSLERLLGFDFPPLGCGNSNSSSSGDDSFMFIKDEFDGLDDQFDDSLSNYELDAQQHLDEAQPLAMLGEPTEEEDELLPSVTTLNGLQYVRIPGTSTYQLLMPDMLTAAAAAAAAAAAVSQDSSSLDEEHFNALIDTNCLNSSSSNNNNNNNNGNGVAAAPAAPSNGECVKFASALSRSPVPTGTTTTASTSPSSSPTTIRRGSSSLHQPPNDAATATAAAVAVAVSPVAVAVANELLLQACAAQQQQQQQLQQQQQQQQQLLQQRQQQQQLIKQEYSEGDFRHVTNNNPQNNNNINNSPPAINNNNFQQLHQQQQQQQQQQLLCSPVLPAFYDQEPAASFYDNVVVGLPSFKKEFTDVLHDQSTNTAGGCLSDESMIDAIDWWEAHTPKSDAGTVGGL